MTLVELWRDYWWMIFPIAGLGFGFLGMLGDQRRQERALDILRTYAEQGKEPPPELLRALSRAGGEDTGGALGLNWAASPDEARDHAARTLWGRFFLFAALAAGFAVGAGVQWSENSNAPTAFLIVTVVMSIMAVGSLVLAISAGFRGRK